MNIETSIFLKSVSLNYDLHFDRTYNFKEFVVNTLARKKFIDKKKESFLALDNIDLRIIHGERLGIIGRNGAGKSSLLKVISGIYKPTKGDLKVSGHIQPLIEIGAGFDPEFTGRENIYLNGYMLGFTPSQIREKEKEIIEFAELENFIDIPIKYYSSGMAVRLAFTIATSIEPEILIFDEMLSAGDAAFMVKAQNRMKSLLDKAKIMVIVSHDMSVIRNLCNRALVVETGKVVFDGSAEESLAFYDQLIKETVEKTNS